MARGEMSGKVALITGAGSGLGRVTALTFAEAGAMLCLVDVNADGLAETDALLSGSGVERLVHSADLAEPVSCDAAVAAAMRSSWPLCRAGRQASTLAFLPFSKAIGRPR